MRLRFSFLLIAIVIAATAGGQTRSFDITGWYSMIDPRGDNQLRFSRLTTDIEFDGESGYGAGVNIFWSKHISLELAAYAVDAGVIGRQIDPTFPAVSFNNLEMIPITATAQFHLLPQSRFDPYAGVGLAYVLFDDLGRIESSRNLEIERIDFKDDYGLVANIGLNIGLTDNFALNVDAKYVPLESSAQLVYTAAPGQDLEIAVNPVILSAGLSFRF